MNAMRAILLLPVALAGCDGAEPELLRARGELELQVAERSRVLSEQAPLDDYSAKLDAWRSRALEEPASRPLVPEPPVPLTSAPLRPLAIPEVPGPRTFESGRVKDLRAELTALVARARTLERQLSDLEQRRAAAAAALAEVRALDQSIARSREDPLLDLPWAGADGGTPANP